MAWYAVPVLSVLVGVACGVVGIVTNASWMFIFAALFIFGAIPMNFIRTRGGREHPGRQ